MKSLIVKSFGDPHQLELVETPRPEPASGKILIRVLAAAVNRIDLSTRNGNLAHAGLLAPAEAYSLGWDVAGEVVEVGPEVRGFAVGDRVIGLRDVLSDAGTHAEYVALDAAAVALAPTSVSIEHAAALPLAGLTAERSLTLSGVSAGQTLLVTGAAGGVGHLLVELAALRRVVVVAQASASDFEDLLARGATHVIDREADLARAVRTIVPGGVDAVIDGAVLGVPAHEALRGGGRFIALVAPFAPPPLRGTTVVVQEVFADGASLTVLSALVDAGHLTLRVAETFPLVEAADAHAAYERGGVRGRIVIIP